MANHILKVLTVAGALSLAEPTAAQDCRLALVLALDVSSSVDTREDRLQREGLAHALTSPEVVRAFLAGDPVALYAFQWSGPASQVPLLPGWVMVDSEEDLAWVAQVMVESERASSRYHTALGAALAHAAAAITAAPECRARTVDVSGDGVNNEGPEPQAVYGTPAFDGVTVNALIVRRPPEQERRAAWVDESGPLVGWFHSVVLHGPGAFGMVADGFEDYERAMIAKLRRELEVPLVSDEIGGADAG